MRTILVLLALAVSGEPRPRNWRDEERRIAAAGAAARLAQACVPAAAEPLPLAAVHPPAGAWPACPLVPAFVETNRYLSSMSSGISMPDGSPGLALGSTALLPLIASRACKAPISACWRCHRAHTAVLLYPPCASAHPI